MRKSVFYEKIDFHEKIGEAGGRQKMCGGVGEAGAPPTNMFGFKSPSGDLKPNRNTKNPVFWNPVLWNPVLWNPEFVGNSEMGTLCVLLCFMILLGTTWATTNHSEGSWVHRGFFFGGGT